MSEKKILLGLTTTPGSDWKENIREIDKFGIKEIALFPTFLKSEERKELYGLLEKTGLESAPHVHIRQEDMSQKELDYLISRFKVKVFNMHTPGRYGKMEFDYSENKRYAKMTYIENGHIIPKEEDLKKSQTRLQRTLSEYGGQSAADKALGESAAEYEARKRAAAKPIEDEILNYRKSIINLLNQQAEVQRRLNDLNGTDVKQQQGQVEQTKNLLKAKQSSGLEEFNAAKKEIEFQQLSIQFGEVQKSQAEDLLDLINARIRAEQEEIDKQLELQKNINETFQYISMGEGALSGLTKSFSDNKLVQLDNEYNKQKENIENTITDEKEKREALNSLDKDYQEQVRAEKKKAAEADKLWSIEQSISRTALAVITALTSLPPNPAMAIAAGVTGAIQTGIIAARQIPEFAEGGYLSSRVGGYLARVAEDTRAKGEFMLPDRDDFMSRLATRLQTALPQPTGSINNITPVFHVFNEFKNGQLNTYITEQSRKGNIIIDSNHGISKR